MERRDLFENPQLPQHDLVVRTAVDSTAGQSTGVPLENRRRDQAEPASPYPRPISSASFTSARRAALPRRIRHWPGRWLRPAAQMCSPAPRWRRSARGRCRSAAPAPPRSARPSRARRLFERRRLAVLVLRVELGRHRPPADAADVIADAVHHRLPQVGLQGPFAARVERLQMLKRLQHRFLDNVLRVGQVARPPRAAGRAPSGAAAARSGRRGRRWPPGRRPGRVRAG